MLDVSELPKAVQERLEELKQKDLLAEEELAFLRARSDYLTDEEKEKFFQGAEVVVEAPKKRGRKPAQATTE